MEMNEFIANFVEQLDSMEELNLTAETKFRELDDWSSLVALSVIAMVDEEYDVTIAGNDIKAATTIGDLYNCVQSKL